ncbi:MAG: imidazole glycerol phosphate synthase subunit HisH [Treponema sp.]|jgi:imidazole glycerol phosphate synthase glutamine amidotransferase subunit|nr:imidazole glycerol phosphate synthase subunit HisH [Treponema sp.]
MIRSGLIGVLNYGAGNLGSVMNALERLGAKARFVQGPEELKAPDSSPYGKLLFPGDGHFGTTMESLENSGYAEVLRGWLKADKSFLGICIGLQVLFEASEEAPGVKGLGVMKGTVKRFPGRKVPQIGWNSTAAQPASRLFRGLSENAFFYYIHSYYVESGETGTVAATAEYYLRYCAAVERSNAAAVQFHPEKSGAVGLALLENWLQDGAVQ